MNYLDQLDQMFDAKYRLIAMETYDPKRVEELITQLSRLSNKAYYISRPGRGMARVGASHIEIPRTRETMEILNHIYDARHFGVYILCDFHHALEESAVVNRLLEIIKSDSPKVVMLLGANIELPPRLKPYTMRSKHQIKSTA
ncbi:MAG: hypothetical protein OEZ39_09720 [Gammaproteobacteria bacterium]|nr:hypothetical protein [Gammaproteobacteria bacterium]MDH5652122.1 hypothetical protein [Gammaproteobacteria bacterium]